MQGHRTRRAELKGRCAGISVSSPEFIQSPVEASTWPSEPEQGPQGVLAQELSPGSGSTERPRGPGNVPRRKRGSERSRDRCGVSSAQQQPPKRQVPILESVNGDFHGKRALRV